MYGVMLLLGIAACIWLTGRRWVSWGGDWDLVFRVALWGVIFGVVGARGYHDITSWSQDPAIHQHWWGFAAVWDGGLGIWGAIPAGVLDRKSTRLNSSHVEISYAVFCLKKKKKKKKKPITKKKKKCRAERKSCITRKMSEI